MIQPVLRDDAFLASVHAARALPDSLHLWWLGQSGFLLQWRGRHLLFDPYLSDSLTRKYAGTDKPHVRMTERVIDPARLGFVDVVTSSHNHTDHLDVETLRPLLAANPSLTVVVPEANRVFAAERLGLVPEQLFGINAGDRKPCGPFAIEALPSAHEAIETDPLGRQRYLGYVAALGPWRVYHSGDTVLYDGLAGRLRQLAVDIALLPINGRAPERRVAGNLTGPEAAQLAKDAGIRWVVPCHYEMFGFNTASPDAFTAACERLRQPYRLLRAGERWSIAAPSPLASES